MERIFELAGEGGTITFAVENGNYFYTTEEAAIQEDVELIDIKSHSELHSDFYSAMIDLLKKYPVFHLHPERMNKKYKETVRIYFDNYILYRGEEKNWEKKEWEKILSY